MSPLVCSGGWSTSETDQRPKRAAAGNLNDHDHDDMCRWVVPLCGCWRRGSLGSLHDSLIDKERVHVVLQLDLEAVLRELHRFQLADDDSAETKIPGRLKRARNLAQPRSMPTRSDSRRWHTVHYVLD